MRFAIAAVVAALPLVVLGAASAALNASQLAELPTRGPIQPDPLASFAELVTLGIAIAVYVTLGRYVARHGGGERDAVWSGAIAGAIAAGAGGALSAFALGDYLTARLGTLAADEIVFVARAIYVVLGGIAGAVLGAAATWAGLRWGRGKPRSAG